MLGGRQKGRTRVLTALVALVVLATASACSGVGPIGRSGGGGRGAAKPVITPRQARSVVMRLQAKRVSAIGSENLIALKSIDSEPQLSVDEGAIHTARSKNLSISDAPYLTTTTLVPKQTAYPAWFMAIARDSSGSSLDLFDRRSLKQPWLLVAETGLPSGSVPWEQTRGGWAVPATPAADPSRALAAYWNQTTNGADVSGAAVASGNWTSGVAAQINSAVANNKAHNWAQIAIFSADGPLTDGLKLTDGSVLSFAWVTEVLKTRDAYGGCFLQPDSSGFRWDPLVSNGNYLEIDVTYTWVEGMSVPEDGALVAEGYEEGTTAVSGTRCGA